MPPVRIQTRVGQMEAWEVCRVIVEGHMPEGARNVEAEHTAVRLEQMVQLLYLLETARKLVRILVDATGVVHHTCFPEQARVSMRVRLRKFSPPGRSGW